MIDLRTHPEHIRSEVMAAVSALETSEDAVAANHFAALRDNAMRQIVVDVLHENGRCLLARGEGRWTSGYEDSVADDVLAAGIGTLDAGDRAVLALVLLHCVAIPRAAGRITSTDWTDAESVDRKVLKFNRSLSGQDIDRSLRRLQARGILRRGHRAEIRPGPQFLRLTEARSQALWEDLVLLCRPDGHQAAHIRRRRTTTKGAA
ncbi:MAG: hypothetical protein QOG15_1979 [Solirubrobacteraceae bacterium]|nr:hypothetical protein [Solirubrobacteraceae bacterium]